VDGNIVVTSTLGPQTTCVLKVSECCDFNGNGRVDISDIQTVAAHWGLADPAYDFDGNGMVDLIDLLVVVNRWDQMM